MNSAQFTLDGSTALVTGGSRGIGKALAVGLARAGADIVGVSARLSLSASDVQREVQSTGRGFWAYSCDFSNRKALYEFIQHLKNDGRQIDILINNAGTI